MGNSSWSNNDHCIFLCWRPAVEVPDWLSEVRGGLLSQGGCTHGTHKIGAKRQYVWIIILEWSKVAIETAHLQMTYLLKCFCFKSNAELPEGICKMRCKLGASFFGILQLVLCCSPRNTWYFDLFSGDHTWHYPN